MSTTEPVFAPADSLLRFATAGAVDDGKSTLIGRLLHDSKSLLADQLEQLEVASKERGDEQLDLAMLTDGLRAEREQGITIDVAYRFFATSRRSFILADTPGHVRYTRNMVTGASTADLALVLIDARQGVLEQSRRHAFIASLLRVPHIVAVVNKMDLVDFDEETFLRIAEDFRAFARRMGADIVIDSSREDPVQEIMRLTGGRGVDVAIEALGTQASFEAALRVLRPGGTLSSLGVYSTDLTIPLGAFSAGLGDNRIVTTLCPGGKERMRRLMDVVAAGRINLEAMVTHHFKLEEIESAYELFSHQRDGVLKVSITP